MWSSPLRSSYGVPSEYVQGKEYVQGNKGSVIMHVCVLDSDDGNLTFGQGKEYVQLEWECQLEALIFVSLCRGEGRHPGIIRENISVPV
jgi:hypothetical protein